MTICDILYRIFNAIHDRHKKLSVGLENRRGGNLTVGSNPTPSARSMTYSEIHARISRKRRERKRFIPARESAQFVAATFLARVAHVAPANEPCRAVGPTSSSSSSSS
jgi:hypothetical protein